MRLRARLPLALLSVALILSGVLVYKAYSAARSQRATAERTLKDYAAFATWAYAEHARRQILTALISTFVRHVSRVDPNLPPDKQPKPGELAESAREIDAWCHCLHDVHFFFRYDWRDNTLVVDGVPPSDAVRRWVRDTVVAQGRTMETPRGILPLAWGSSGTEPLHRLGVILTNDSYMLVVDRVDGSARLLGYVLSRDLFGKPVVTYGFESDAAPFVAPLLGRIIDRETLLPPSLIPKMPIDSVLAVTVADPVGDVVYRSSARIPAAYAAGERLDDRFGRLTVRVALSPAIADQLLVGGLPRSQLPMLLVLFALTAGLVVVAALQIRRQQELARMRTEFVSGVSHELRTPLTQIRLFAELLERDILSNPEERRRSARVIDQEARRLTYLVENILSFAKSEHGAMHLRREPLDVAREVRDVVDTFAPLTNARRAKVEVEVTPGLVAHADRSALRQMLLNLLDNALKYGPPGQTVTVRGEPMPSGGGVRLMVDDRGPGVEVQSRERIFEPYYRLDRDARSEVGGSGIGLAVVNELVERHGGKASVDTAPEGGARFIIELPNEYSPDARPSGVGRQSSERPMAERSTDI